MAYGKERGATNDDERRLGGRCPGGPTAGSVAFTASPNQRVSTNKRSRRCPSSISGVYLDLLSSFLFIKATENDYVSVSCFFYSWKPRQQEFCFVFTQVYQREKFPLLSIGDSCVL